MAKPGNRWRVDRQCADRQAKPRWRTDETSRVSQPESSPLDFPPDVPQTVRRTLDSVVYQGPPPVADSSSAPSTRGELPVARFPLGSLRLAGRNQDAIDRQKPIAWWGSALVHIALVLIAAFLLARIEFEPERRLVLTIRRAGPPDPAPPEMMLIDATADDESSPDSDANEDQMVDVDPMDFAFQIGRPNIRARGVADQKGRSDGDGGPKSSFFGIEAEGERFVYIVDCSGSMNGSRYRRAVEELNRSVAELRSDQRFYVLLFNFDSLPMFGRSIFDNQMVAPTDETLVNLERWLDGTRPGGGTNPTSSLMAAFRMNPSAVFILSDGEFSDSGRPARGTRPGKPGTAIRVVQRLSGSIPVHAIAFEDPRSCKNMQQIAEMTGGQYRFVNSWGKTQTQLIEESRVLLRTPQSESRENRQIDLCREFASTQVSTNSKRDFARRLVEEFERNQSDAARTVVDGNTDDSIEQYELLLRSLITMDPHRVACETIQNRIAKEFAARLAIETDADTRRALCDRMIRWPRLPATTDVLDAFTEPFSRIEETDPRPAYNRLRLVMALHPRTKLVPIFRDALDRCEGLVTGEAKQLYEQGDVASALTLLRTALEGEGDPTVRTVTYLTLQRMTFAQLFASRTATRRGDHAGAEQIEQELKTGFAGDPMLTVFRRDWKTLRGRQEFAISNPAGL